jgi:hypothetical protein
MSQGSLVGKKSLDALINLDAQILNLNPFATGELYVGQKQKWVGELAKTEAYILNTLSSSQPVNMTSDAQDIALAASIKATVISSVLATLTTNLNATLVLVGTAFGFTAPVLV